MTSEPRTRRVPERYAAFLDERGMDPGIAWGLGNVIAAGAMVVALLEERVMREAGLTNAGWRLLTTISINGPTEPRELARLLYLSRPAVVNGLNTLERAKLITRIPDDADRRLVRAVITDEGSDLFERITPAVYAVQQEALALLNEDERATIVSLTGRLAYAVRKLHEQATATRPRGRMASTAAERREEDAAL